MLNNGMDPSEGDQYHEPPYNLLFYQTLINNISTKNLAIFFIICDIVTTVLIYFSAKLYLEKSFKRQCGIFKKYIGDERNGKLEDMSHYRQSNIFLTVGNVRNFPMYCALFYQFNPFSIFNCVAQTTTTITNIIAAVLLLGIITDSLYVSVVTVSLAATQELYPVIFVFPVVIKFSYDAEDRFRTSRAVGMFAIVIAHVVALLFLANAFTGSWMFAKNVYAFILSVDSLRPNIGLFWYFFTEMFEHFRDLFIAAFQINILLLYIVPLTIKFRKDSFFLTVILMLIHTVFKSYPSLGNVGFGFSLLPIWMNLFAYLQQGFLVLIVLGITSMLGPVVWYQWIVTNSANANFYFGVTLCFASAQIFMITDVLFAYVKREFWLKNNCKGMSREKRLKLNLE